MAKKLSQSERAARESRIRKEARKRKLANQYLIKSTPSGSPLKVSRATKTAMILNGSINPSGNELVEKSSKKNFKTVGVRKYKMQIEYYNDGSDEPNFMTVPSRSRLTTEEIIEIFQKHTEYGIEGSDEQPFNVTRAKIWMN